MIEGEVCVDHVHMLLEIPPKYPVSSIMGYIKGKVSTKNGEMQGTGIGIGSFGAEDIMWMR